jgi:DNA (cytosine-5)-methyltransferase 1
MRHGSLFSGIGGFDLAAQWMGWTNVFHTEWNEFGQKVLQHHFPNSISYHDIIKTDYTIHNGDIEIITGGFPCQPFSLAGKRKGTDDERYLWHEMLRAIQQIQPTYVVAENVRGLLTIDGGMVFEQVCADLEAEGYEVQPILLPAAGVNAPHRRDRIFIVGYAANTKDNRAGKLRNESGKERTRFCNVVSGKPCGLSASTGTAANTDENGNSSQGQSSEVERDRCRNNGIKEQRQQSTEWTDGLHGFQSDAANTMCSRRQRQGIGQRQRAEICDTNCCSNAWQKFPTESAICGGNDGIPDRLDNITFPKWRNESIKAYGNAVVPQLILPIFQTIEKLHREKNT